MISVVVVAVVAMRETTITWTSTADLETNYSNIQYYIFLKLEDTLRSHPYW